MAFECTVWETLTSESRRIFIGQVLRLHAHFARLREDVAGVQRLAEELPLHDREFLGTHVDEELADHHQEDGEADDADNDVRVEK